MNPKRSSRRVYANSKTELFSRAATLETETVQHANDNCREPFERVDRHQSGFVGQYDFATSQDDRHDRHQNTKPGDLDSLFRVAGRNRRIGTG